jgi:hypothetical protein
VVDRGEVRSRLTAVWQGIAHAWSTLNDSVRLCAFDTVAALRVLITR